MRNNKKEYGFRILTSIVFLLISATIFSHIAFVLGSIEYAIISVLVAVIIVLLSITIEQRKNIREIKDKSSRILNDLITVISDEFVVDGKTSLEDIKLVASVIKNREEGIRDGE